MKTRTYFSTIITLSLVIFAATSGISNPVNNYTGDNLKKTENKIGSTEKIEVSVPANSAEAVSELSYLRFDVNEYSNESAVTELPVNSFDYLRFDVNNYTETENSESMELPVKNAFNYLRFDVNNFTESNTDSMIELPVNEFDYLRFDVNNFTTAGNSMIDELPLNE